MSCLPWKAGHLCICLGLRELCGTPWTPVGFRFQFRLSDGCRLMPILRGSQAYHAQVPTELKDVLLIALTLREVDRDPDGKTNRDCQLQLGGNCFESPS